MQSSSTNEFFPEGILLEPTPRLDCGWFGFQFLNRAKVRIRRLLSGMPVSSSRKISIARQQGRAGQSCDIFQDEVQFGLAFPQQDFAALKFIRMTQGVVLGLNTCLAITQERTTNPRANRGRRNLLEQRLGMSDEILISELRKPCSPLPEQFGSEIRPVPLQNAALDRSCGDIGFRPPPAADYATQVADQVRDVEFDPRNPGQ